MNIELDKELMKGIHNQNKKANERIERENEIERKNLKKKEKKEFVQTIILTIIGIALIVLLGVWNKNYTDKQIEQCVAGGHDRYFCEAHL